MNTRLPDWLPVDHPDTGTDHGVREQRAPDEPPWQATGTDTLQLRVLELVRGSGRLVAELRSQEVSSTVPDGAGLEMYVRRGALTVDGVRATPGTYLRLPPRDGQPQPLTLEPATLIVFSIGHMLTSDLEQRVIDTTLAEAWFAGPVEGVEVLPLHGHGSSNVMLVRWHATAAFHPKLDPAGEEVFVLAGELHDSRGSYGTGAWIRNPVPSWQSWGGTSGTLVWYKSGHFPGGTGTDETDAPPT